MASMNFKREIVAPVLSSLNWATVQEAYAPSNITSPSSPPLLLTFYLVMGPSDVAADQVKSVKQKTRLDKRKAVSDALTSTREELFTGEFDGCAYYSIPLDQG
jgi:tRNA (adenine-N(1)-)-methyltransferase non-catalytic subunit